MVISDTSGKVEGISFDSREGLRINATLYGGNFGECKCSFPLNVNTPKDELDMCKFRNKRIKVTVELLG